MIFISLDKNSIIVLEENYENQNFWPLGALRDPPPCALIGAMYTIWKNFVSPTHKDNSY